MKPAGELPSAGGEESRSLHEAMAREKDDPRAALVHLRRVVDGGDFATWRGGSILLMRLAEEARRTARRTARLAVLGSYTTGQFVDLLRIAAHRFGIFLEIYEAGFDQYRQEILDPASGLYRFKPDVVLLAVHAGALELPEESSDPNGDVAREVTRWSELWHSIENAGARVIQHNFVVHNDPVYGHLARTNPGSRVSMMEAVNRGLISVSGPGVTIVDCDAISARIGKDNWHDPRYWFVAKQAVALGALPVLARHSAAILAAQLGLSRKVLVLDLDNTLWGGTIGDDGIERIVLGAGSAEGEAYVAFQQFCKRMADRGVILAICSKNDSEVARRPFREHPDMELKEEDIAIFVANWRSKPDNLREIAASLGLGLDSLVFVDDNPAEREFVRRSLPDVEVIELPLDPAGFVSAVADSLLFEVATVTDEDRQRTEQYRARAMANTIRESASSMEDFYASLGMEARVACFDEMHLPRIVQLINKTNQFNLTTKRYTEQAIRLLMAQPSAFTLYVKLRDRLADHGLISAIIAVEEGDALVIDTWVMSCRVIGRTVERTALGHLVDEARVRGLATIIGRYRPTDRNGLVAGLFAELGFEQVGQDDESIRWCLRLPAERTANEFIKEAS